LSIKNKKSKGKHQKEMQLQVPTKKTLIEHQKQKIKGRNPNITFAHSC
jgi:hypothetical protein